MAPRGGDSEVLSSKSAMRAWSRACRRAGRHVALVPTMGALHGGHVALVREAQRRADVVVVSVYVNAAQFAPHEDLRTYPRDLEGDLRTLRDLNVDAVFAPSDLYCSSEGLNSGPAGANGSEHSTDEKRGETFAEEYETWVQVEELQKVLEGESRPHFFKGVATVVTKLFHIVEPDIAIFGRKDFQQWRIICKMVKDLDFAVEVVGAPLVREADGLAMSSRNVRLSETQRCQALAISRSLREAERAVKEGETCGRTLEDRTKAAIEEAGGCVDYVKMVDAESLHPIATINRHAVLLVAVFYGTVRLIDNMELLPQKA